MAPVSVVEVQTLQVDQNITFLNSTPLYNAPPIQGQIMGTYTGGGNSVLAMYCLQLDSTNYFDQTAPAGATHPFPASGDTTGYVDFNVWFPNLVLPVILEPVVFWNTDVGPSGSPVSICSAGNNGSGLKWASSAGIDQLSVIIYVYDSAFTATTPP